VLAASQAQKQAQEKEKGRLKVAMQVIYMY
jgi:hypothetical protein